MLVLAAWLLLRAGTTGLERWLMAAGYSQVALAVTTLPSSVPAVEVAWLAANLSQTYKGWLERRDRRPEPPQLPEPGGSAAAGP